MAGIGALVGIIGTVVSAAGAMQQSNSQAAMMDAQAQQQQQEAQQERAVASQKADQETRKEQVALSKQQAAFGASGGGMGGSAGTVMAHTAGQGLYNNDMQLWQGEEAARGHEYQGQIDEMGADSYRSAGGFKVASAVLGGAKSLYGSSPDAGSSGSGLYYG